MASDPTWLIQQLITAPGQIGQDVQRNRALSIQEQNANTDQQRIGIAAAAQQREADTEAAFFHDYQDYLSDGSLDKLAQLAAKYPAHADGVKQSYAMLDKQVLQNRVGIFGELFNAAKNNRADLASARLRAIRDAEQAAGSTGTGLSGVTPEIDEILGELEGPNKAAALARLRSFAQLQLAAAQPEKFADVFSSLNSQFKVAAPGATVFNEESGQQAFTAPERSTFRTVRDPDGRASVLKFGGAGAAFDPAGFLSTALPGATMTSGTRTPEEQAALLASGATTTPGGYHVAGGGFDVRPIAGMSFSKARAMVGKQAASQGMKLVEAIDESRSGGTGPHWHFAVVPKEGGAETVYKSERGKPSYRLLGGGEARKMNLDPSMVWQMGPDGKVSAVSGQGGGKGPGSVSAVMAPIYAKVAAGKPLTPGEQQAWNSYTRAPRGRQAKPPAAAPAGAPVAVGKDGQRLVWNGKSWTAGGGR